MLWRAVASSCRSKRRAKVTAWFECSLQLELGEGRGHRALFAMIMGDLISAKRLADALRGFFFFIRDMRKREKKNTYFEVGETRVLDSGAITAAITIISSLWYLQVLLGSLRR